MGQQKNDTVGAGERNTPEQDRRTDIPRGQQPDNTGKVDKDVSPDPGREREKGHSETDITGHTEGGEARSDGEGHGPDQDQGRP
ncbi:MAG TPA: hypothetical protein VGE21_10155 [Flavobacteriales bacterium]